mmetsp:Transcript_14915/g.37088  ORF Transcript_14915/g.37088 Transcript_14915/m.37088 type:complete len:206 (-) Transcript_14915:226-843(-)
MRGIRQKVDARAVPVDSLHVVLSPHKRRALRAHKVHLQPLGLRLEHWPQVALLVRAIQLVDALEVKRPVELPALGRLEVGRHPLRALRCEALAGELVDELLARGEGRLESAHETDRVPGMVATITPHVAGHGVEHPHLYGAWHHAAGLLHHAHHDLTAKGVPHEHDWVDLEVVKQCDHVERGGLDSIRTRRRPPRRLAVAAQVDQ